MDWNVQAQRVAGYIQKHMASTGLGAVSFGPADCAVLFGNEVLFRNDGPAAGAENGDRLVKQLRANIPVNYSEAGFNTSDAAASSTWAIILRAHMGAADMKVLNQFVWDSYGRLFTGHESLVAKQREVSFPHIKPLA